jgi:PPM family protein phosphatase
MVTNVIPQLPSGFCNKLSGRQAGTFEVRYNPKFIRDRHKPSRKLGTKFEYGFDPRSWSIRLGLDTSQLDSRDRKAGVDLLERDARGVMRIRPGVELASMSDIGCQRENNEDRYAYWEPDADEEFARKGRLAIVADGMGGHEGGQEASRIAVETIQEVFSETSGANPQSLLVTGFQIAHERILEYASGHPEFHGMGTTATAIALVGSQLYFAHVGDSRLCLVRGTSLSRLSRDHSYVGRLVENGVISSEEAETHPQRHILTAALGAGTESLPDTPPKPIALQKGDVLVLCTDGLWSLLSESEIQTVVAGRQVQEACQALIKTAKDRGAPDNITVQLLRIS